MSTYLRRYLDRPNDIDPETPRGFAIGTTIAAVLIMILPAVGIIFAVAWQISHSMMPAGLAIVASATLMFTVMLACIPAVVWIYWAAVRSVQGSQNQEAK